MLKRYGLVGSVKLFFSYLYTKIFFTNARLIRLPFDIRNRRNIQIGDNFTSGFGCRIEAFPLVENSEEKVLQIGKNVQINDYVHIAAAEKVKIGDNVLMASKIFISDISHGNYSESGDENSFPSVSPHLRPLFTDPVIIEDNVWLGEFVSILPGVTLGEGCIIGSNSVVTKSIPKYCIAVGNPAKVVKIFDEKQKKWLKI